MAVCEAGLPGMYTVRGGAGSCDGNVLIGG